MLFNIYIFTLSRRLLLDERSYSVPLIRPYWVGLNAFKRLLIEPVLLGAFQFNYQRFDMMS